MSACLLAYFRWYNSLPPISKTFGTLCVFTAALVQLQILDPTFLALYYPFVFKHFQVCIGFCFECFHFSLTNIPFQIFAPKWLIVNLH
jgi:hypothetical protein